jgi:hypothetical protein
MDSAWRHYDKVTLSKGDAINSGNRAVPLQHGLW